MDSFWSSLSYLLQNFLGRLPIVALMVAICAAICAIYVAIQSKREARLAAQVNLFYQLMARYSSPEMGKALDIMRDLFETRVQDEAAFIKVVKKYRNKDFSLSILRHPTGNIVVQVGEPLELFRHNYEETNQARLQVSSFFTFTFDLFTDFRVLDDIYFKKICSIDTFKFLYHVIEWLELALNPDYARKTFTDLLKQSGRNDIEDLESRRPPGAWTEIERIVSMRQ